MSQPTDARCSRYCVTSRGQGGVLQNVYSGWVMSVATYACLISEGGEEDNENFVR